jgi:hypothetical protein
MLNQRKQKWSELDNLNLYGFDCYLRQPIKNSDKFLYHFKKETERSKFINIVSEFVNIEFCLQNELTLDKQTISKLVK